MTITHRAIFSDFDGTISKRDIGYHIFTHFSGGKNAEVIEKWKRQEVSTRDCLLIEASLVSASKETILAFIDDFEIDKTFPLFYQRCKHNALPMVIISEGMDFYIKQILKQNNLTGLSLISNIGSLEKDSICIEFPHMNKKCKLCGNCKAERIEEYRLGVGEKCEIAFIGDGYSDACAAREADLLFAKKDLELYCRKYKIEYIPYDDFDDVTSELASRGWFNNSE